MNILQKLSVASITLGAGLVVAVTPVSAQTMQQQRQSFSSETSFSSSCEGTNCSGKHEFKSTTDVHQEQRQSSGMSANGGMKHHWNDWDNHGWNWDDADEVNTDGEVKLTWSMRDGTCYIQYRMAGQAGWPYSTQANCNEGSKTIGGLQEGKNYQFRIKKNDGRWSRPMTRRAE